jgi:heme exporter protein D
MNEFLSMGGYAGYVWPAYALSFLGVGGLAFAIWRRGRALRSRLERLQSSRRDNP